MPSTGVNNGTLVGLYKGGTLVNKLLANGISINMATRDATTKDSGGWEEVLEGLRSAEMSFECYYTEDGSINFEDFFDQIKDPSSGDPTTFVARFSSEVVGDVYYEGTAYVTSLEASASKEESMSYSGTLKITGAVTKGTVV